MERKIEKLISEMTLDEKLGQLTQEVTNVSSIDKLSKLAEQGMLGSCLLTDTPWAGSVTMEGISVSYLNKIQRAAVEKSRLGIPVMYGCDIIHGSKTIFPIPLAQAATWDYDLIRDAASVMSEEASYDSIHWTFAPMLDICCDPRWGRIIETPGEDPLIGQMFAKASVEGIQGKDMSEKGKLAACAKHYIGYGASSGGRDKDGTEWSDYSLRNRALPAFKAAIDENVATVMSAFNEISGQPATSSKYHLTDLLKGELGFDGFVVSDFDAVKRLTCQGVSDNDETSAVLAINAGVDMDMADGLYKNNLKSAVEKGLVSMSVIDEAVRRVLRIKFRMGLFDNPYADENVSPEEYMKKEYLEKAKQVSMHAMVLLQNNGVLPLAKGTKVSVKGPMAEEKPALLGSWHAEGQADDVVSLGEGIQKINGEENTFVHPCTQEDMYCNDDFSNVYIVAVGESEKVTGEGCTISNIELSGRQVDCIRAAKELGKKVVAVIFAGRPLAITSIVPYCDAILWAWHGGTMCGEAAAEIIFGDFNPSGKLPVTIPRSTGQIPICYNHQRNEYVKAWYSTHHRYVSKDSLSTPLFEFGFGLSYSDYQYSNFEYRFNSACQQAEISFDVTNSGDHEGYEIAQCYICDIVASMSRPVKELKAFEKIHLKKGETKKVTLTLSKDDLSFYDGRGNFVFEEGEFRIEIGKSSSNICFETTEYISFES
ncbi:MAG: glycoside hydrolase family 3 C-terminal domain-containing protein [Clostridia bacterium]|nr:glycoside hydrolase family 3 C-terminal domain-containing protein [Clostridia bacterium]